MPSLFRFMSEEKIISPSDEKSASLSDESSRPSAGTVHLLQAPAKPGHLPPPEKPALLPPPAADEPPARPPEGPGPLGGASSAVDEKPAPSEKREPASPAAEASREDPEARAAGEESPLARSSFAGLLGTLGGLSLSAALLLFAAAHFLGWSPLVRLSFFGSLAVAAFLPLLLLRNSGKLTRDISASAGGLLLGLFLVVIGQTWQTGEGAASLMLAWSGLLIPWLLYASRPVIFSLWFVVTLTAACLQGEQMAESFGLLEKLLPAAFLSFTAALLFAVIQWKSSGSAFRAAGMLPAASAALLLGIVPAVDLEYGVSGTPSLLSLAYFAGALIFSAAAFFSKRPELRALALLTLLAWVNGFVVRFGESAHIASDEGLLYILTLLNGLVFLGWILFRAKRTRLQKDGAGDTQNFLDWICRRIPQTAGALMGAAAALLLAATIFTLFSLSGTAAGNILLACGVLMEIARKIQAFRQKRASELPQFSALRIIAFTLAAAGWVVLGGSLSSASAVGILIAIALIAAALYRSRIALVAAFLVGALSPDFQNPWFLYLPAAASGASAVLIAVLLFAREKSAMEREALWWLPALLLAQWLLPLFVQFSIISEEALPPDASQWIGAAALLITAAAALLRDKRNALRTVLVFAGAALAGAAFSASASLLLCLSADAAYALKRRLQPGVLFLILSLALLECGRVYWQSPESGVNLLLKGAVMQGIAGAGLLLSCLALTLQSEKASALRAQLHLKILPLLILILTSAALFSSIAARTEIAEAGTRYAAELMPSDPRDIVMGDFMTLNYAADGREALEAYRKESSARGSDADSDDRVLFCAAGNEGVLTILSAAGNGEACPAGTTLRLPSDRNSSWRMAPKLPHRWFFPSGDAERFEGARFAELRCLKDRCLITGLLDKEKKPILPSQNSSGPQAP